MQIDNLLDPVASHYLCIFLLSLPEKIYKFIFACTIGRPFHEEISTRTSYGPGCANKGNPLSNSSVFLLVFTDRQCKLLLIMIILQNL